MNLEDQYDRIYRYLYFHLHDKHEAEDLTQEAFLRFLGSRTYQDENRQLQYLYTIARNLCNQYYRERTITYSLEELGENSILYEAKNDFVMEGRSIRMLDNHSISIREGQTGYRDFATDESGNSVDFLVRYMGYELDDAIFALCRNTEEEHITTYTRPVLSVSENDLPPR